MKVLIPYPSNPKYDYFEGARLRKTIKSALETMRIPYTDTMVDDFDVAHFLYPEDDSVISELNERKIPFIVSALYCEDDPTASYIEYKNKDGYKKYTIKSKFIKFLDKASLVLVPNYMARQLLIDAGVTTEIKVCYPGVNFARFDFSRDDEKEIFYRYFSCDRDKKIVFAVGDSSAGIDGLNVVLNAARMCEDVNFYYYSKGEKGLRLSGQVKRAIKKLPKNVTFSNLLPDDVYRSALLNADIYLHPGYKPAGIVSIFEAMAAKCQLVVRKQDGLKDIAIDQETAYVASYSETLAEIIKDYFEGKIKPTYENAYELVSTYDLKYVGDKLIEFYNSVLQKEEQ